jgi:hypothetical protein
MQPPWIEVCGEFVRKTGLSPGARVERLVALLERMVGRHDR